MIVSRGRKYRPAAIGRPGPEACDFPRLVQAECSRRYKIDRLISRRGEVRRCPWAGSDPAMVAYHDREWGRPVHDDRILFEFLTLEGAQAGLSWSTILRKREGYRRAFASFDPAKVARFDKARIRRLLEDDGIVRNRLKIESTISNARALLRTQKEFGSFDRYIWQFVGGKPLRRSRRTLRDIPATAPESDAMSEDLKKRGFRFVGSTICYAFMQACGLVNDHVAGCSAGGRG
ncbi:MAG: DNA-3-methyladenine glycosylase I [Deltaproteobacteria bacterium]|nr:MAG: DNA-3-methyladenine glycosylase I [Deltaproteobacteria bacterium]